QVLAIFNDPTRKQNNRIRSYLLTGGLSVCGKCGSPLWARPRAGKRRYGCPSGPALPGCGGVSCHADPLEELVREAVFEALSSAKLLQALRSQESHGDLGEMMAKIHRIEVRLEELAQDHYVEELISKSEYLAARQGLEHRLEEARRELRRASRSDVLSTLPSAEGLIRQAWEDGDLAWRRNLLATVLERVVLNRAAVPGWNFFDPERVDLIWRW
ncbi:MAG: zinc ribbon domain-containing protein, partial [bacterium]